MLLAYLLQFTTILDSRSNDTVYKISGFFPIAQGTNQDGQAEADAFLCAINRINSNPSYLPGIKLVPQVIDSVPPSLLDRLDYTQLDPEAIGVVAPEQPFRILELDTVLLGNDQVIFDYNSFIVLGVSQVLVGENEDNLRVYPSISYIYRSIFNTLKLFNWKVFGAVFSYNVYGLGGEATALALENKDPSYYLECRIVIDGNNTSDFNTIKNFASCIANKNIKVVLIWADALVAYQAISLCYQDPRNKNVIFLATPNWTEDTLFGIPATFQLDPNDYPPFPQSYLEGNRAFLFRYAKLCTEPGFRAGAKAVSRICRHRQHR